MSAPMIPTLPGYGDLQLIANGSTALVFRATQARLNRMVAVKVLLIDDLMTTEATVAQELKTIVALSSQPYIVGIIDTGMTPDGNPYIVMEYCEGGSYAQILKQRGPLTVPEVLEVGIKIGEALHAAHQAGIVHRDVKPPNILRSQFGPALADFGIARAPDQLAGTLTMGKLTPHHASPEAFLLEAQSGSSDLYSLSSTMWNLLAGRPPFADPNASNDPMSFRERVLNQPVPRVPREDVPEWLQEELARAMAKKPAERHSSALAFSEALRRHSYAMNATAATATNDASIAAANHAATGFAPPPPQAAPYAPPQPAAQPVPTTDGGWPMWPSPEQTDQNAPKSWEPVPEWQQQSTALAGPDLLAGHAPATEAPQQNTQGTVQRTGPTGFTAPSLVPPVSAPPSGFPTSGGPATGFPTSGAPVTGYPTSGPPSMYPTSAPPVSGPPQVSAPPYRAPEQAWPQQPYPAYAPPPPPPRGGSRKPVILLSTAAVVLVGVIIAGVVALNAGGGGTPTPKPTLTIGTVSEGAPANLRITTDTGSAVTLTWTDQTAGKTQSLIFTRRSTEAVSQSPQTNPAGATTVTINGLLSTSQYCFKVASFFSVDKPLATSQEVCTTRTLPSTSAKPTPTRS